MVAHLPPDWPAGWGAGVVDAEALRSASLPNAAGRSAAVSVSGSKDDQVARLSVLLDDADPGVVRQTLGVRFDASGLDLDMLLHRFEGELAYHVIESDAFRDSLLTVGTLVAGSTGIPATMSPHLAIALTGSTPV